MTLNNLAVLRHVQGQLRTSSALYQRALAILEQALGEKHPKVTACRANYAGLVRAMNRSGSPQSGQGLSQPSGQEGFSPCLLDSPVRSVP